MRPPLADREGVSASRVQVLPGPWRSALAFLVAHFPDVSPNTWRGRFDRGLVFDAEGRACGPDQAIRVGDTLHYYREVEAEPRIPFEADILHQDVHLLVVDKPHFLPVMPSGRYVRECLLARLRQALQLPDLVPLHRIDRDTAGLVLFSVDARTRAKYQALFPQRAVHKTYEALAVHRTDLEFPVVRRSRLAPGEPFFRTRERPGEPNSETRIELAERRGSHSLYRLFPLTGRKHQLRVHLAALGAPIVNDPLYPDLRVVPDGDYSRPLQLLARGLEFTDPVTGNARRFESLRRL